MQFRKIQLTNFRSHIDTTLDLKPLTFIRGINAAGKSSIEQAIEITLASRCDGTTSDGKGASGLIRAGADKANIKIAVSNDDGSGNRSERILQCALREGKRSLVVSKADDPKWTGGQDWEDWLNTNREVLSSLVNNRRFVDMDEDKQKSVLASIILPKTYTWPDWLQPMCFELGLKINWAKTPFEIIEEGYKAAYAERTNINRDLKNFVMPTGNTDAAVHLATIQTKLNQLRDELADARGRRAAYMAQVDGREATKQQAEQRLGDAKARLSREQQEVAGIEAQILSKDALKKESGIAKGAAKAKELDDEIVRIGVEIASNRGSISALGKLGNACPTCNTELTPEVLAALTQPLIDAREALDGRQKKALDERKALGDPQGAKSNLDAHERAQTDLKRCQERISEDQTAIADAEAKLAELRGVAAVTSGPDAIDAEIAKITVKVEKGEVAYREAHEAVELAKRIEEAKITRALLQTRSANIEKVVAYFDADGVKAELLKSTIGGFTEAMNRTLKEWGYSCQLSIDPYVFAITFEGTTIPLKHLSKSQRYRFAVAFQVALAVLSGFLFVVVDEADIYDKPGKGGLFRALTSAGLEQVIVMGTDDNESVPDLKDHDVVFYRLDNVAPAGAVPITKARVLMPALLPAQG